jgi:uncharacterized protein (TIGR00645 family)
MYAASGRRIRAYIDETMNEAERQTGFRRPGHRFHARLEPSEAVRPSLMSNRSRRGARLESRSPLSRPGDSSMIERFIERLLFASRWLLAPLYLGLALGLIALAVKFFQEAFHAIVTIITIPEPELVLVVLALIDLSLVGSLLVMVMFSGYENFVSRIDAASEKDALGWLGKLDSGTLKLKVAASIVAISSIHLLRIFMQALDTPNDKIMWYVILHLTFVVSAVLLGVLDRMSFAVHRAPGDHAK